jgi:replicative DNA helicase
MMNLSSHGLPQNVEAERSILGAILLDNTVCDEAMLLIKRSDFFLDSHRRIFEKMAGLWEKGQPIDLITLTDELRRANEFEQIGGATYIASLIDGVPRTDTIAPYAKIVKGKAMLRALVTVGHRLVSLALDEEDEPEQIVEAAERMVFEIAQSESSQSFKGVGELAAVRLEKLEAMAGRPDMITGIPTGYTDFDNMTAGLQPDELITIAARPGMGKTALGLCMAQYAAKATEQPFPIFSLEMSGEQLITRLLSSEARVDSHRLRTGCLNREEWARLADALRRLCETQIYIDDSASLTVPLMRGKLRRLKAERGLCGVLVDYLQLMSGHGRFESRQQEVSQISRDLKAVAKEFHVPVIALSQLSRAPEARSDHRPQLSDLRESGGIEQDSDVVAFIYRDEVYNRTDENRGVAELILSKQRNGPTGTVQLAWISEYTRFESMWRE